MNTFDKTIDVIIPSAGSGSRAGLGYNKVLARLNGRPIIEQTVELFAKRDDIHDIYVVCREQDLDEMRRILSVFPQVRFAIGGATRSDSVRAGLTLSTASKVLVHDGARPYCPQEVIDRVIDALSTHSAVVPTCKVVDTYKTVDSEGYVTSTIDRESLRDIQTPQGFDRESLLKAYSIYNGNATDDSTIFECVDRVYTVDGDRANVKLTFPEDYTPIATPTMEVGGEYRMGIGIDAHRLGEGRRLVLGGIEIPYTMGLIGHSDADVVLHALTDSLLSSVGLRDIGCRYPDTDDKYLGIDSSILLLDSLKDIRALGYEVVNCSIVIVAQRPKLKDYIPAIATSIEEIMGVPHGTVSITATTTEKLGYAGSGEGIATEVVSLVRRIR